MLGDDELAIGLFKKYGELSYNFEYESDTVLMSICKRINKGTSKDEYLKHI